METPKHKPEASRNELDEALIEDEEVREALLVGFKYGNITLEDAEVALWAFRQARGIPYGDDDKLAGPLGYCEENSSIYD